MKKKVTFAFIMAIFTTGIVTFAAISVNLGFNANFLMIWLKSWSISYIVAVPAILIIAPKVEAFVNYLYAGENKN